MAVGIDGANDETWFSCRAQNQETGKELWLDVRSEPSDEPRFSRVVNAGRIIYYNLEHLDPSVRWSFVFGVHPLRRVEVMVAQPELETNSPEF